MIEVYPQVRFFTEVRFNNKPFATVVAGMPESSRNSGSFDGMTGSFFSSSTANEAILQIEFAKDLSDKPASLVGQELVLRYAERQALPAHDDSGHRDCGGSVAADFPWCPKELRLKIVGIVETEPAARLWRLRQRAIADAACHRVHPARGASERFARHRARQHRQQDHLSFTLRARQIALAG